MKIEDVSRETYARLEVYAALILKWNKAINLVSNTSEADLWNRHISDSVQLLSFVPKNISSWVDLGSGGGLPGIVVAAVLLETHPDAHVTLIESDQRKATFLREAIRAVEAKATVISDRIETTPPIRADVVSARALSELTELVGFLKLHGNQNAVGLFPKGRRFAEEVSNAKKYWHFDVVAHPSLTDKEARILEISKANPIHVTS